VALAEAMARRRALTRSEIFSASLGIIIALLDRGADPSIADDQGFVPLMHFVFLGSVDIVARVLQDPRVRATVNMQPNTGYTALHDVCLHKDETKATSIIHILLQAGGNAALTSKHGQTPLDLIRHRHPPPHAASTLLKQALAEAKKASLLVKARCLAVAANSSAVAPSC